MSKLETHIKSVINISENDLRDLIGYFEPKEIKKNKFLVREGQIMDRFYFITSGGLRVYLNHEEKQITAWLSFENDWLTDIACQKTGRPTAYNIQALEDTELMTIKSDEMNKLYDKYPSWQEFGRKLWENAFLEVVDGMIRYQTMSAEERYLHFIKRSDILQRVPLKLLSSFLGITPTSLSRLRKNIQK